MLTANNINQSLIFNTQHKIVVTRHAKEIAYPNAIDQIVDQLSDYQGAVYSSNFEFPGRYTCWDVGFVNPPLAITAYAQSFQIEALNLRGKVLLKILYPLLTGLDHVAVLELDDNSIHGQIKSSNTHFTEEQRSKQASFFSVLRAIISAFSTNEDEHLGLYGAFAYDLAFQFDPIATKLTREPTQRDLVLYLPDEIMVVNHRHENAKIFQYDFSYGEYNTQNLARTGECNPYQPATELAQSRSMPPGAYADIVRLAKKYFERGDLFEVVPGQSFLTLCEAKPSQVFYRLRARNPAPYGFLINLGAAEYLVGASPEMFVRVNGHHVETRPISGTIARGASAIDDTQQILALLNSTKDESELTMCTDVDRNDKSRICIPGSVQVTGRREIEKYSRLFHTVDHVEGIMRDGYDAIDAFLTHAWVVTVTGAPKLSAMQFIEDHETSPRCWYAGAVGWLGFNGNMNTGLSIRTAQIKNGIAEVRAGATLLFDSDPDAEEQETQLKASALLDAILHETVVTQESKQFQVKVIDRPKKILLIDHQDSFVHTLANYFRQTQAEVITLRAGFDESELDAIAPDLIVLSPGPGRPVDFNLNRSITLALNKKIAIFGVCLGLQGIVEYYGGELKTLNYPMHGKASTIHVLGGKLLHDLPRSFSVGRYHSLYIQQQDIPAELLVCAATKEGVVMAIEHKTLPIAAVQFHPESILTLTDNLGLQIINNAVAMLLQNRTCQSA